MKKILILGIFITTLGGYNNKIYSKDFDIIIDNLKTTVLDFWNKSTEHVEKYYANLKINFDKQVDAIQDLFEQEKGAISFETVKLFKELKDKAQTDLDALKEQFEKAAERAKSSEHFIVEKIEREHHKNQAAKEAQVTTEAKISNGLETN